MKLADWARQQGVCYRTAHRMFRSGTLPIPCKQLPTGTILVYPEREAASGVVIYGRVSTYDQKEELVDQVSRLRDFAAARGLAVVSEVSEVGDGLSRDLPKLLRILSDPNVSTILVERSDRLSSFGFKYLEACLGASGRSVLVMNQTEDTSGIVQDMLDVMTSLCSKLYGRWTASARATRAVQAAKGE